MISNALLHFEGDFWLCEAFQNVFLHFVAVKVSAVIHQMVKLPRLRLSSIILHERIWLLGELG